MQTISSIVFDTRRMGALSLNEARELLSCAQKKGITRFDVSMHFMGGASESTFIEAIKGLSFKPEISYKFGRVPNASDTEESFLREFYAALERFSAESFDMYTVYDINSFETWNEYRDADAVYKTAVKLRGRGLIKQLSVVSSLEAGELSKVISACPEIDCIHMPISPLTLKKSADVLKLCAEKNKRVYALTPLMGGLFEQYPELLRPINISGLSPLQASFGMIFGAGIDMICDFPDKSGLDAILSAASSVSDIPADADLGEYETFCTGCGLCRMCPIKSQAPVLMAAYNAYIVSGRTEDMVEYARRAFGEDEYLYNTRKCIGCRLCERICPQGIKISERIERLKNEAHKT